MKYLSSSVYATLTHVRKYSSEWSEYAARHLPDQHNRAHLVRFEWENLAEETDRVREPQPHHAEHIQQVPHAKGDPKEKW